ncbi:MAG: hypothetical protein ACOWWM_09595 [Desulfobacterales bacterium]
MAERTVEIGVEILWETDPKTTGKCKAYKVTDGVCDPVWITMYQIRRMRKVSGGHIIEIPERLARQKGFVA